MVGGYRNGGSPASNTFSEKTNVKPVTNAAVGIKELIRNAGIFVLIQVLIKILRTKRRPVCAKHGIK